MATQAIVQRDNSLDHCASSVSSTRRNTAQLTALQLAELSASIATITLESYHRADLGQFFTKPDLAKFMASLFGPPTSHIRLLDPGAGAGSLTAAFIEDTLHRPLLPASIVVTAYEIDAALIAYLNRTLDECSRVCSAAGVRFDAQVIQADFLVAAKFTLTPNLLSQSATTYNRIIMNPPYKKIHSQSQQRQLLRSIGIETGNLYTAFLALALQLLEPTGEIVAITPRSFCNGPYYRPFRRILLHQVAIRRLHIFKSRDRAFREGDVLQENIILHAIKGAAPETVMISASDGPEDLLPTFYEIAYQQMVKPGDPEQLIHIPTGPNDRLVLDRLAAFDHTLEDLDLSVSTGRVVDFRVQEALRQLPEADTAPLIYPTHLTSGFVRWPKPTAKKPNAIAVNPDTHDLLLPTGWYVLVRRFTAKEEPRRVVAALFDPDRCSAPNVAFENHLDVYHQHNQGLTPLIAKGLALYLNSTLVDSYLRQFSGHTQVNATDLRALTYPSLETLQTLGSHVGSALPTQAEIDDLLEQEIKAMTEIESPNPVSAKNKIDQALDILRQLGLPRGQLNERSALTLLALLDLKPDTDWAQAQAPRIGITPIMDFVRLHYGKAYAPNTRETFRRQTMHQFLQATLAVPNPDDPNRPTNSPKTIYQIAENALTLLRTFGSTEWDAQLEAYRSTVQPLSAKYARRRQMAMIPVTLHDETKIYLTSGKHNALTAAIVEEFRPRFAPGAKPIYIGDTGDKWACYLPEEFEKIGVHVNTHGKMPDVVLYDADRGWLFLIEAVTSHGPVDPTRRLELEQLFQHARPALIYVTAFDTMADMAKYVREISWETEVWIREAETHLIHFDGEKFLGPHKPEQS